MKEIKLYELFSGYGSQEYSLRHIINKFFKDKYTVNLVGRSEWFISAIIVHYLVNNHPIKTNLENVSLDNITFSSNSKTPTKPNYFSRLKQSKKDFILPYLKDFVSNPNNNTDILTLEKLPNDLDILTYSFPCWQISNQGKKSGMMDKLKGSGLVWQVIRVLKNTQNKPKVLVMENVDAIVNNNFIDQFNLVIDELTKMGYKSKYKIINAKDVGSSQNRKRCIMVSWLDKTKDFDFLTNGFSFEDKLIKDVLVDNPRTVLKTLDMSKISTPKMSTSKSLIESGKLNHYSFKSQDRYLTINSPKGFTLTTNGESWKILDKDNQVKYLSPMDCYLYMGLDLNTVKNILQNTDFSKRIHTTLAGNSICIETLDYVFWNILKQLF